MRAGCPRTLDYSKRDEPFWALKEHLVHTLLMAEYTAEFLKLLAQQKSGMQGFPPPGVNAEIVDHFRSDAIAAVKEFGRKTLPWLDWPTPEQVKKSQEDQLAGGAQALIDAWIRNFDPDNADAYKAQSGGI